MQTLQEYQALTQGKDCKWCRKQVYDSEGKKQGESRVYLDTPNIEIEHYDHDGGYPVKGFKEKQWLYITCPTCQYQWSFRKLGIVSLSEIID